MTWSIVAKDANTGLFGIAIASRFFAVGALCPWAGPDGAISTQALMNPLIGSRGLALLGEGLHAPDVLEMLVSADEGRAERQFHIVDSQGRAAAHTGHACVDWSGQQVGESFSIAGNMLAGPQVVAETADAYLGGAGLGLVERLLAAMTAGEAAGGDKRGRQSAALLIQGSEPYPRLSLRVDDHQDPLPELARLYEVSKQRFLAFSLGFPRPDQPHGITERSRLDAIIEREAGQPLDAIIASKH